MYGELYEFTLSTLGALFDFVVSVPDQVSLQCFDTVVWAAGRASGL